MPRSTACAGRQARTAIASHSPHQCICLYTLTTPEAENTITDREWRRKQPLIRRERTFANRSRVWAETAATLRDRAFANGRGRWQDPQPDAEDDPTNKHRNVRKRAAQRRLRC